MRLSTARLHDTGTRGDGGGGASSSSSTSRSHSVPPQTHFLPEALDGATSAKTQAALEAAPSDEPPVGLPAFTAKGTLGRRKLNEGDDRGCPPQKKSRA